MAWAATPQPYRAPASLVATGFRLTGPGQAGHGEFARRDFAIWEATPQQWVLIGFFA